MTSSSLPARLSPRPVRTLRSRISRSEFARSLHDDRYFLAACALILFCAFLVGLLSGSVYIDWSGVHHIPAEVYTGTDAGLLPPDAGRPVE